VPRVAIAGYRVRRTALLLALLALMPALARAPGPAAPVPGAPAAALPPAHLSLLTGGVMDVRWATSADTALTTAPGFDATTAYVPTRDGALTARDLETGAARWRVEAATPYAPAVGGDLVYVVVRGGVRALAATTGAVRWQRTLPGTVAAPPYWDTGWLILSFEGGDLAAFRAADGELVWRVSLGSVAHVAPAPALDNLYLGLDDGRTVALALASGQTVWTRATEGRATGVTALDDQVLVGTSAGVLWSLDPRTGRVRWRWRTGASIVAAAAADEAHIYVLAYDHILRALDRGNGNLRWRRPLPHRPAGAPMVIDGTVIVPSFSTELAGYDAVKGTPTLSMASTSEVAGSTRFRVGGRVTGTRITAVSTDGQLIAFGPRIEPPVEPLGALPGTASPEPPPPPPQAPVPPPSR
jgi:outer membrane protein assembly factor BamB